MTAKSAIVRNIARSPFVIFPLGAAVIVVLLSAWFSLNDDTLAVNQGFLGLLVSIPVIVALCLVAGGRFWNPASTRNFGRWLWSWLGSSVLALVFASVSFAVVGPVDEAAYADYNYLHFDRDAYVTADQRRVAAGSLAPDQTIYDLDGNEVQLSTLWQSRPVVIEFGSVSCPVFDSRISPMEQLANEYQGQADFFVLYTREAHPGQNYPAHQSLTEKIDFARDLKRIESIERTMLVDDVAGTMHRTYGAWPDSAYIIGRDGVIAFLAQWNEPDKLRERLDILLEDDGYAAASPPVNLTSNSPGGGSTMMESSQRVLGRAGFAAVADFVVGYPKMMLGGSPASTESESTALAADTSAAEPGAKAPDFRLKDLQEKPVQLSDFLGTPVVLNFFASWCGPCLTELPLLQEAHLKSKARGFVVLGVGYQDSRGAIEILAEDMNLTFPIVIDGDNSVGRAYRVIGPPYTFFIDAEGAVIDVIAGAMEQHVLERYLNQLVIGPIDAT